MNAILWLVFVLVLIMALSIVGCGTQDGRFPFFQYGQHNRYTFTLNGNGQ